MKLHKALKSKSTSIMKMLLETDEETKKIQFVGKWPNYFHFLHQPSKHGACFSTIPQMLMQGHNFRMLWIITSILTTIPIMWKETVNCFKDNVKWNKMDGC